MTPEVLIKRVRLKDLEALLQLSKKTFFDTFYHLNKADDMLAYADKNFTKPQFKRELEHPWSQFYFALIDEVVVGYIKINFGPAQTEFQENDALEIERIYVDAAHQGKQIGKQLLNFAIEIAISKQFKYIWLGVWEHNHKAIKFYQHNDFQEFATHDFWLGSDLQKDVLMKRVL
jgi:ribosomal protein S18 acetylase RimI-like enzyme